MNPGTGGTVSPPSGWYNSGSGVSISASTDNGYTFASWSGTGNGSYSGTSNNATVTMNGPISETANFTSTPPQTKTYTVTNTNDSGPGSLRQAILNANASSGTDLIAFNIAGAGVRTIAPLSPLPLITDPVIIDGYTQPGATQNTLVSGDNAVLLIELSGINAESGQSGIGIQAGNSTVRGLVINSFLQGTAIELHTKGGNTVQGNFIGTDATGASGLGNLRSGIMILEGANNNTIGGTAPSARNIISGGSSYGVDIIYSTGNSILGNYIGTDASGMADLGNYTGIVIGVGNASENSSDNIIGGPAAGAGNIIAFNRNFGVWVVGGRATGNLIRSNRIFSNSLLGINLINEDSDRVTPNDLGDPDVGGNALQNFPVLTSAMSDGSDITIQGTLNSMTNGAFTIEFFSNTICHSSGCGEGKKPLGLLSVMTDGSGNAIFSSVIPSAGVSAGQFITATATDKNGNTSEFSACAQVTAQAPSPTPPTLLVDETTGWAAALNSVTFVRDPFSITTGNFSPNQRTRVILFAMNVELMAGENISALTAQAEDAQHKIYPLTVEYVGKVPDLAWLTQINVKLPDELANAGIVQVSISLHGVASNKVTIRIR